MKILPLAAANLLLVLTLSLAQVLLVPEAQAHGNPQALVYHPAELLHAEGQANVLKRIRSTARRTCSNYGQVRELAELARCRRAAVNDLVSQINDRKFTRYVQRSVKSGGQPIQLVTLH